MLGLSSTYFAFKGKGIYDSAKAVFDLWFDTVELGAGHVFEPRALGAVKRLKRDFPDKNYTVHGLFPPLREKLWFNASLGLTPKNRRIISGMFKAAEATEAGVVSIHPGFLSELGPVGDAGGMSNPRPLRAIQKEKCLRNFYSVVRYSLGLAKNTGAAFAIENINGKEAKPLVESVSDFRSVFSLFPELWMLFDYGHALFGENTEGLLGNFSEKIEQVHLHWSAPGSAKHTAEDHAPITSAKQLEPLRKIRRIAEIPVIFEHGANVGEAEIAAEKKLTETFFENF